MSLRAAGLIIYRAGKTPPEPCSYVLPHEYLLLRASYPPHHWSPPKGHNDPGETDIQAAVRETEEETGYSLTDYELNKYFKKELSYEVNGKNKTVAYFMAKMKGSKNPIMSREHSDFKWVTLEEACEIFEHDQMIDLYHAADLHLTLTHTPEKAESMIDLSDIPIASKDSDKSEH